MMSPARLARPQGDEAADYYYAYIDLIESADICAVLEQQRAETAAFLRTIPEARAHHRYEAGKWSVNGVLAHVNDCERLFTFRAFWFARGFDSPLPSFDQHLAASHDAAATRTVASLADEFDHLRHASLDFYRALPDDAWLRRGIASDSPFTVRALAYLTAGHVIHHTRILRAKYL
jgi:hypothetical protein